LHHDGSLACTLAQPNRFEQQQSMATQAEYLADLLALQVLNTDVAHHINRGIYDALVDYFVNDARYEDDTQSFKGRDAIIRWFRARSQASMRHSYSAVRVLMVDETVARGSSLRVSYVARTSPHDPTLASPLIYDVDDVYQLEGDGRWRIASRTERSVHP
jgi:hypothetical protein